LDQTITLAQRPQTVFALERPSLGIKKGIKKGIKNGIKNG
jgi:hypothetical protein|tara:strand:+ start:5454 stop:5573 length:120 start_codon:yes stop_codon:yes gene_type:complete